MVLGYSAPGNSHSIFITRKLLAEQSCLSSVNTNTYTQTYHGEVLRHISLWKSSPLRGSSTREGSVTGRTLGWVRKLHFEH